MTFTPEFILQVLIIAGSCFTVYTAIRADLATLHERTKTTKERADEAHKRIDRLEI